MWPHFQALQLHTEASMRFHVPSSPVMKRSRKNTDLANQITWDVRCTRYTSLWVFYFNITKLAPEYLCHSSYTEGHQLSRRSFNIGKDTFASTHCSNKVAFSAQTASECGHMRATYFQQCSEVSSLCPGLHIHLYSELQSVTGTNWYVTVWVTSAVWTVTSSFLEHLTVCEYNTFGIGNMNIVICVN